MNLFELMYPQFKFKRDHPIRLFEAFAGIGCQRMAFKKLNIQVESVGISEIDKYALRSYKAIHGDCNNWGNIIEVKGDYLPEIDIFTWSFPCTDLSKAGKQKGLVNTRSGLCFEVLRILREAHKSDRLPRVLIMENVVDLIQTKFISQFNEIQAELESLGYKNYYKTLNAKDYGIPQNRNRVFMISVLGDYYYEFPKPIPLERKLSDVLEDKVDKKYYLSEYGLKYITNEKRLGKHTKINGDVSNCLTSRYPMNLQGTYINECVLDGTLSGMKWDKTMDVNRRVYDPQGISPTIHTCQSGNSHCKVIERDCKNSRIRRLTPLECWRLMGIDDVYYNMAKDDGLSDSQLYKQAGNGIVVDVFAAIVKGLIEMGNLL